MIREIRLPGEQRQRHPIAGETMQREDGVQSGTSAGDRVALTLLAWKADLAYHGRVGGLLSASNV